MNRRLTTLALITTMTLTLPAPLIANANANPFAKLLKPRGSNSGAILKLTRKSIKAEIRSMPKIRSASFPDATSIKQLVELQNNHDKSNFINIIGIAPESEDSFGKMFPGRTQSTKADKDLLQFAKSVAKYHQNSRLLTDMDTDMLSYFKGIFDQMENDLLVISGHSIGENGKRFLVSPGGHAVDLDRIRELAVEAKKQVVFLTCYSDDLEGIKNVTFKSASRWIRNLERLPPEADWEYTVGFIAMNYLSSQSDQKMLLAAAGIGTGLSAGVITYFNLNNLDDQIED